jgi:ABC-type transport system involved in multi-copper enzyme maturation permease subunit
VRDLTVTSLFVVAHNTFRETVRDKILYNLVFFALLLIGLSVLLGTLTIGEQSKIVSDVGLGAIDLVGVIIAIFVGIGLVSKEIERRTIYTILARPITRTEFILGKYAGLGCVMMVNLAIMVAMFLLTVVLSGNPIHGSLFQAIQLILVETLLVTALAMFFSTFSSPTLSAIMTIGFYVIGHLTTDLKGIAEKSQNPVSETIMSGLYYLCPNLEWLNIKGQAARGVMVTGEYQLAATVYGLLYASLLLFGACRIFEGRDF